MIDEESMLEFLLREQVLFCNQRYYSIGKNCPSEGQTVVLFVIANDIFGPAADAEDLDLTILPELYKLYQEFKDMGVVKWLVKKRKRQPWRREIIERMQKLGLWEVEFGEFDGYNK